MNITTRIEQKKKRLQKSKEKRIIVKTEQIGLCRFIEIRYQVFEKDITGSYKRTGETVAKGLQYENKIYFSDGKFKYLNSSSVKIEKAYQGIPQWADTVLINLYYKYMNEEQELCIVGES